MADLVADGRLQLGLATGGANAGAFAAFGLDPAHVGQCPKAQAYLREWHEPASSS